MCPVRSIGLSNSFRTLVPEWWVFTSSQSDTSTDGVELMSLMYETHGPQWMSVYVMIMAMCARDMGRRAGPHRHVCT